MQRDKPVNWVAAAACIDEVTADDAPEESPEAEVQEDESPPADAERDEIPLDSVECPDDVAREIAEEVSHYEWDTEDDREEIPPYKVYAIGAPESGCLKLTCVGVMCYVMPPARGFDHKQQLDTCLCAGVKAE